MKDNLYVVKNIDHPDVNRCVVRFSNSTNKNEAARILHGIIKEIESQGNVLTSRTWDIDEMQSVIKKKYPDIEILPIGSDHNNEIYL